VPAGHLELRFRGGWPILIELDLVAGEVATVRLS
jgi:hypothetical protein